MVYVVQYTIRRCPHDREARPHHRPHPAEFEAALHFMSKGYKIVDFSTEPADPAEPDQETE